MKKIFFLTILGLATSFPLLADSGSGVFISPKGTTGVFDGRKETLREINVQQSTGSGRNWDNYRNSDRSFRNYNRYPRYINNYYYNDDGYYDGYGYPNYYNYPSTYNNYIPPPRAEFYNNITNPSPSDLRRDTVRFKPSRNF